MGGNLFENTTRIDRLHYDDLVETMLTYFRTHLPKTRIDVIPSYRNKTSHGDIDLQIERTSELSRIRELIADISDCAPLHKNGYVFSWPQEYWTHLDGRKGLITEYVQVDLISQAPRDYDTALSYYSWNDLGNIMGRLGHRLGFKYGHEGLVLIFRDGTHQYAETVVSRDIKKIVEFLGYDYEVFKNGFDDLEDIFDFATNSPFFNKDIFAYENRNHIAKTRDKKRATYRAFLEYINSKPMKYAYHYETMSEKGGRVLKDEFRERAYAFFPDLEETVNQIEFEHQKTKDVQAKFNGDIVSVLTGLTGKELGGFMTYLRNRLDRDGLYQMTPLDINHLVLDLYKEYAK